MNKIVLSLLLALGAGGTAQAQFRVGAKAGANLSRIVGGDVTEVQSRFGFLGGVILHAPVTSDGFFAIQPEILYSQKGYQTTGSGISTRTRLNYVDVPILLRINAAGFIFEGGPQVGYLASIRQEREVAGVTETNADLNGYERFTLGYVAGVGYQLGSGAHLGLRYNGTLNSLLETRLGAATPQVYNSAFQLFVGYIFKD